MLLCPLGNNKNTLVKEFEDVARAVIDNSADCSEEESELGRGRRQKKQKQAALDDDDASQSNAPKRRKLMSKVRHDRSLSSDVLQKLKVLRENQSVIVFFNVVQLSL